MGTRALTQVVVQLPLSESTDFDSLIGIENGLTELLLRHRGVRVDSHDIGHDRFNIFISSEEPWSAILGGIRAYLEFHGILGAAVIAARPLEGGTYEVLWPADHVGAFEP